MKYILSIVLLSLICNGANTLDLVRETRHGLIQGIVARSKSNPAIEYYSFKGIPYGQPPIGNLRFQEPLPPNKWLDVKNASVSANICAQLMDEVKGSEDCLYLEVFEPITSKQQQNELLPVMVWIHGGVFIVGTGNQNGPEYFMEKPVVIVSIQYRLNVFGFLSTEDDHAKGNIGLKDQVLALKWVKENIANFSGDPNNVTIFGESAGGISVLYHMVSPSSKGLFHKAISQSGSTLSRGGLQTRPKEMLLKLVKGLGIETNSTKLMIQKLQSIDYKILLKAAFNSSIMGFSLPYNEQPFAPIIESESDTAFISESTFALLEEGKINKVPHIMGFNTEEGAVAYWSVNDGTVDLNIYETNPELLIPISMNINNKSDCYDKVIKGIRSFYFKNGSLADKKNWIPFQSQELFVRGITKSIEFLYKIIPLYVYRLSYSGNNSMSFLGGVSHGEDIQYLFNPAYSKSPPNRTESDILTSKRMVTMWTNFATTGNPTPENDGLLQNMIWPQVNSSRAFLDIGSNLTVLKNPDLVDYEFWEELFESCGNPPYYTY